MPLNKKLRLLITEECVRQCPQCCNKQFNVEGIPIVEHFNYDEIMITGGEPFLFPYDVRTMVATIRSTNKLLGHRIPKIYVYTAPFEKRLDRIRIYQQLFADGFTITLHHQSEVDKFVFFAKYLSQMGLDNCLSLRLNLHENVTIPEKANLSKWAVKQISWQKECPLPEGEDFRRIAQLLKLKK